MRGKMNFNSINFNPIRVISRIYKWVYFPNTETFSVSEDLRSLQEEYSEPTNNNFEYSLNEILALIPTTFREYVRGKLRHTIQTGVPGEVEYPIEILPEKKIWVYCVFHLQEHEDHGKICVGILQDVSHHMKLREAHQESEEKFAQFADLAQQPVFEISPTGTFLFTNEAARINFRFTTEQFANGIQLEDVVVPEERALIRKNFQNKIVDC